MPYLSTMPKKPGLGGMYYFLYIFLKAEGLGASLRESGREGQFAAQKGKKELEKRSVRGVKDWI